MTRRFRPLLVSAFSCMSRTLALTVTRGALKLTNKRAYANTPPSYFDPDPWKYVNQMENRLPHVKVDKPKRDNRRGRREEDPRVLLSKSMSSVLRHNAAKVGLQMRADGYARLDDLVRTSSQSHLVFAEKATRTAWTAQVPRAEFRLDQGSRRRG